jgi:peroxiredoxin
MKRIVASLIVVTASMLSAYSLRAADDAPAAADDEAKILAGHSYHGEAFDQGPRQAAYLMPGTGDVNFPITTKSPEAQKFFNQGMGQMHGFWYFEAERSFRQASALDPDCAMNYWGMALANVNNSKRAEKFIAAAVKHREQAGERERLFIDAWDAFLKVDPKKDDKKARTDAFIKALENIVHEYPDDIEAKAQLVLQIWSARGTVPIGSKQAVDALIDQVLAVNPMHPIHHYRIHLWDEDKAIRALKSAALGGQAAPGIAHQWHMPGHTFSKLERFADAAWQQEAASRTDHAYMIRDFVMPDQIHNYAHNHEWLIRDLSHIGRVRYGVELAKNLTEMPRHPKYNSLQRGTAMYGRTRLIELLQRYELWDEAVALAATPYLEATDVPREQVKRLRLLGIAHGELGQEDEAAQSLTQLEALLTKEKANQKTAGDKAADAAKKSPPKPAAKPTGTAAKTGTTTRTTTTSKPADPIAKARQDAENPFRAQIATLEAAIADLKARAALREENYDDALAEFKKAGITTGEYFSRVQLAARKNSDAEKTARAAAAKSGEKQVVPQANLVYVLWSVGKKDEAKKIFANLRTLAGAADLDVPVMERLAPIAAALKWPKDWRTPAATAADVGVRPALDSLGPIRWTPPAAPSFALKSIAGKTVSSEEAAGRNRIYLFYLGTGCLHCTEQLKAFAKMNGDFQKAGLEIIAVATDDAKTLEEAQAALKKEERYPFPIVPNDDLTVFKKFRAYDDFEKMALHATILVDGAGRIRWIDTGPDPFMETKFLLDESKRLLSLPTDKKPAAGTTAATQGE